MIIEDLIRTGKYLREGGLDAEHLLLLISDATSPQVRNFFQHVFVIELSDDPDGEPKALPKQVWRQEYQQDPKKKATIVEPELRQPALSARYKNLAIPRSLSPPVTKRVLAAC